MQPRGLSDDARRYFPEFRKKNRTSTNHPLAKAPPLRLDLFSGGLDLADYGSDEDN